MPPGRSSPPGRCLTPTSSPASAPPSPTRACSRSGRALASAAPTTSTSRRWRASPSSAPASSRASRRSRCAIVSNEIGEPDRALWRFDDAFAALAEVLPAARRGSVLRVSKKAAAAAAAARDPHRRAARRRDDEGSTATISGASLAARDQPAVVNQITAGGKTLVQARRARRGRAADGRVVHRRLGDRRRRSASRARTWCALSSWARSSSLPAAFLSLLFILPAVAWLALFGLVVPVLVLEASADRRRLPASDRAGACRLRPCRSARSRRSRSSSGSCG